MNALWSRNSDLSREHTAVLVDINSAFVHAFSVLLAMMGNMEIHVIHGEPLLSINYCVFFKNL